MDDDDQQERPAQNRAKQLKFKYRDLLQKVADRYEDEITIDLDDLARVGISIRCPRCYLLIGYQYDELLEENQTPMGLVSSIENNAKHYLEVMSRAVEKIMPQPTREIK
jgi:DNA replication licensing factor MCM7